MFVATGLNIYNALANVALLLCTKNAAACDKFILKANAKFWYSLSSETSFFYVKYGWL